MSHTLKCPQVIMHMQQERLPNMHSLRELKSYYRRDIGYVSNKYDTSSCNFTMQSGKLL